ncbi:MAG: hypothetical protein DCE86_16610 [Flavobacteriaceae bacterium]|uniref:hypothetical protein n=2 Tax=Flavobacterium TaxID=237 RepID=UPI0006F7914C|nr:hypothetical protein [Flavobacterium sp. Leaf359]KQS53399.1 hypothetical protein ASG38_01300 [Flavobacterium sp. Leaf359]PZO24477.1 MAG: hypothetical protein DCE86_16610 [Flavobacteriaceae bacterium]
MNKSIIIILLFSQLVSCQNRTVKETPKEFISKTQAPKSLLSKDSINLVHLIKEEIKLHKGGYHAESYDDDAVIIIDTIMYSPDFNRLVFFIIDKVENKKLYPKDWDKEKVKPIEKYGNLPYEGYHYNAKAYIALRANGTLQINNFFRLNINDYTNLGEIKNRQKQVFFQEFSAVNEKGFEYNPDDIRFWNNPNVWDKIKQDEAKWKSFNDEKLKNPKNVYEPK